MQYGYFKMVTGEEIITQYETQDDGMEFINPAVIQATQNGIMFHPYMAFRDNPKNNEAIPFKSKHIMVGLNPNAALLAEYKRLFEVESILVPGEKKIIVS